MTTNQLDETTEKKSWLIKPFSKMHKGALLYYILSFVVLFFKLFILKTDNLSGATYRVGYQEFAYGIGWIYYIANIIGLLTVITPILGFLQNIGTKIISIVNLTISGLLLFKTIPDAIRPTGSIISLISQGELGIGFWLMIGLHTLAVLTFWFLFIRRISKKKEARAMSKETEKETITEQVAEKPIIERDIHDQQ